MKYLKLKTIKTFKHSQQKLNIFNHEYLFNKIKELIIDVLGYDGIYIQEFTTIFDKTPQCKRLVINPKYISFDP